jgi:hypothetical protein
MKVEILNAAEKAVRNAEATKPTVAFGLVFGTSAWFLISLIVTVYLRSRKPRNVFVATNTYEKSNKRRC